MSADRTNYYIKIGQVVEALMDQGWSFERITDALQAVKDATEPGDVITVDDGTDAA